MLKKHFYFMRHIRLRCRDCSRELGVQINQNQYVLISLCLLWQRTEDVHSDDVEWTGGREQL